MPVKVGRELRYDAAEVERWAEGGYRTASRRWSEVAAVHRSRSRTGGKL